jgi:CubicO group peptidase (beta-lactamase class C family)
MEWRRMRAVTTRREVLVGAVAGSMMPAVSPWASAAAAWEPIGLADAGFDADLAARLDQWVRDGRARNIHGVVIVRRGRLALERYYEGEDQVRVPGRRPEVARVAFGAERRHELRSVTKSIVGLLYGLALADRKVPDTSAPLLAQFPQYADLPDMAGRRRWTIGHALTMTLGTEWNEDLPYDDPRNGQTAMEAASDRYRYVLERPIIAEPGERWIYSGGATALVGKIVENGVGQRLPDFARKALFGPLEIADTEWRMSRDGEVNAASGLGMLPRDLARIGQMLLDGGKVGGRQVVPLAWIEAMLKPAVRINAQRQYGYHWYLGEVPFDGSEGRRSERWIGAFGNGGQRLFAFPALDLVVVITAGNYNQRDQGTPPNRVITEVVLPGIR